MAEKKPRKGDKPRPSGRARDLGTVRAVQVEIPVEFDDAIERFAQRTHRTKKGVILLALEKLLTEEGDWPPPDTGP